ncbi:ATP-binding protein [Microcoleus sp. FACHB-1515]|uniref:ATP-binding protein n=1 Tax=Cyanophyceae TaxID=3028117 RepID=UPI00168683B2|nr:ATP-binding protein [Microcoleus sp. FACHB-1515]MBD2093414.1 ATP-binding protein [Microcoleus sp. FACHB-1515]
MLPEPEPGRILLNPSHKPAPDASRVRAQIKALINREFFAETAHLTDLEQWLKKRCEDRLCGRIIGPQRCGKTTIANECVDRISGQKGALRPIPLRAHYTKCLTSWHSRKLFNQITKELGRGARGGQPEDYRLRAYDAVELLRLEALLVDNAHYLTEKAIRDLIELAKDCGISVILMGPTNLDKALKSLDLFEYFQPHYPFSNLAETEFSGLIKTFEREFLGLPESIKLIDSKATTSLFNASAGNFGTLIEILIQVIRDSSTDDAFYFDNQVLSQVLEGYGEIKVAAPV